MTNFPGDFRWSREIKMKKFKDILGRGKGQDNFYSIWDASLCEDMNHTITSKNIYKYFKFDSDCYDKSEPESGKSYDSRTDPNRTNRTEASGTCSVSNSDVVTSPFTDCFHLRVENKVGLKKSQFTPETSEVKEIPRQSKDKIESRKNLYMINISNSKCFHIGPQNSVNITEKGYFESHSGADDFVPQLTFDWNKAFECKEKLNEDCIMLISVHLNNDWKGFVKYLGLEANFLEELQSRNDNNRSLIVYDALQNFLHKFPNTSIGFIINGLNQIAEVSLIQKLMKELNV